jgi:hypothetical protein
LPGTSAHTCNPSYSEGRNQEDSGSKPAQANSSREPISKKPITKIGLMEWLQVKALSSSPRTAKAKRQSLCFVWGQQIFQHYLFEHGKLKRSVLNSYH